MMQFIRSRQTTEGPAPTRYKTKSSRLDRRNEEFRHALDAYLADYTAYQKTRHAEIGGKAGGHAIPRLFERLLAWLQRRAAPRREHGVPACAPGGTRRDLVESGGATATMLASRG